MFKAFIKVLFSFIVLMIVGFPTVRSFYGPKAHKTYHTHAKEKAQCKQPHLDHMVHDNSWNLIKNSQLSSPPVQLKVKGAPMLYILFSMAFIVLALLSIRSRWSFSACRNRAYPSAPKIFLACQTLLI